MTEQLDTGADSSRAKGEEDLGAPASDLEGLVSPRFQMPSRLTVIRHGESEANLFQRASKEGLLKEFPSEYTEKPDREFRLSPLGRRQAEQTGVWLSAQYPEGFDVILVSDHVRAQETAGIICKTAGWDAAVIFLDPLVGEREWGRFAEEDKDYRDETMKRRGRDPYLTTISNGENLRYTRLMSRVLLERGSREMKGDRVLVVSHGEYIEALWSEIAHMNTETHRDFFASGDGDIRNCQVIEFSSVEPGTEKVDGTLQWYRSSCPSAEVFGKWRDINRETFSPQALLDRIEQYPHLDLDSLPGYSDD